ncbi:hypothetical protein B6V00_02130 [ANME-1 cluster archaeon ex4572_4]|nr:MAG: hypothetical protein B6V00_02130 [ANME-1 cluster archaeon ex4572_4]
MDAKLFLAALAVWGAFAVAGILNGVFRESFLAPKVSEHASHVLSTLVLVGVNGRVWSLVLLAVFVAPSFWGCIFQKI